MESVLRFPAVFIKRYFLSNPEKSQHPDRTFGVFCEGFDVLKIFRLFLSPTHAALMAYIILSGCTYDGDVLFHEQGCINCHRFKGSGGMMGPDLTAVAERQSREWMNQYLANPKRKNPQARMPAFTHLSKHERQAIIDFLTH